jgi:diguanylate cyclase (GGDEF)-like protein
VSADQLKIRAPAMKILVVEDSPADMRLLHEAMRDGAPREHPPLLRTARSMAEAEAAVRAEPFDCVLMDLGLPDGDGVGNVRRIRAVRPGQTVVVISGGGGAEQAIEALRHGAQDYLQKGSYTGEVVLRVVRHAMERNDQLLAVERERDQQFRLATRDTLTGVSNRRLLQQLAQHTIAQSRRHGWRFAVAFLDLDGFKQINDDHGHACGDELLRNVGQALGHGVRDIDTVARVGGDEFLILLAPPLELEQAQKVIVRIRDLVGGIKQVCGHPSKISASVGLAFYPDHADTLEGLMACADRAMYRAKHGGPTGWALYAPLDGAPRHPGD